MIVATAVRTKLFLVFVVTCLFLFLLGWFCRDAAIVVHSAFLAFMLHDTLVFHGFILLVYALSLHRWLYSKVTLLVINGVSQLGPPLRDWIELMFLAASNFCEYSGDYFLVSMRSNTDTE